MEAIIRKQQKREFDSDKPKKSAFRLRGREVNPQKINRYIKEHPMRPLSAIKDRSIERMDLACIIPVISRLIYK
jgi:hypothetical protein